MGIKAVVSANTWTNLKTATLNYIFRFELSGAAGLAVGPASAGLTLAPGAAGLAAGNGLVYGTGLAGGALVGAGGALVGAGAGGAVVAAPAGGD